ncbi:uncharacterized protein METZ01_LOCUS349071, partial [marine metagenome]
MAKRWQPLLPAGKTLQFLKVSLLPFGVRWEVKRGTTFWFRHTKVLLGTGLQTTVCPPSYSNYRFVPPRICFESSGKNRFDGGPSSCSFSGTFFVMHLSGYRNL